VSDAKFKTLRHIETVRNHLNTVIHEILHRQEQHDQTKLQSPEAEIFEIYTAKLRGCTYGSPEYHGFLKEMQVALDHHYAEYRHHPEHFEDGIKGMNLVDLIEMICDWKSSTMRHADGDIFKSIEINQKRFGYSDELKTILVNTAKWLQTFKTFHKAEES
jgi:hypothetical protein